MEQFYINPADPSIAYNQLALTDERQPYPYYPYHHRPRPYYPYYPQYPYPYPYPYYHHHHYPYYPGYGHDGGYHHY